MKMCGAGLATGIQLLRGGPIHMPLLARRGGHHLQQHHLQPHHAFAGRVLLQIDYYMAGMRRFVSPCTKPGRHKEYVSGTQASFSSHNSCKLISHRSLILASAALKPGIAGKSKMNEVDAKSRFKAKLYRPAKPGGDALWAFVVLPKAVSEKLPRRGRTTVAGTINAYSFQATLEPDGKLSHWMRVSRELGASAGVDVGDVVTLEVMPVEHEPEPEIPADLQAALTVDSEARSAWDSTTTIVRLDWIHWITSAKQAKTRVQRISNACDMLASGKRRVCCFDQSGYYSKAFSAPETTDY